MLKFVQKGKVIFYLFFTLFVFGLYAIPHTREEDTVFAFNLHNLGRVFERVVQLPEDQNGSFGLTGRDFQEHHQQVF